MAQKHTVKVEHRKLFGKKLKALRKTGILPGNVFGKDVKSTAVQLPVKDFEAIYKTVGETGLLYLQLDTKELPVLIKNVQLDYVTHAPVHIDFHQVNLKEKVKAMIPVELVGEPKAVSEKLGLLLQTLNEIEVEALPNELPEKFEVNVESLANVDEQITVADLKAGQGVTILTENEQVVAKIGELISKEAEEQAAAEAAAAAEAKTEEGAPAAEGEQPTPAAEAKPEEPKA